MPFVKMHSCETLPAQPASGPNLLLQLGRLIIRARSTSPASRAPAATRDRLLHAKLLAAKPSTSTQVQTQPKPETDKPKRNVEAQLSSHVHALWNEQIPVCIEVLLAPDCRECFMSLSRDDEEASYNKLHSQPRGLLLERWTMQALINKNHESPTFTTSQWLLNAIRSQLHFSQLGAWLARLKETGADDNPTERRRKLSREKCNYKKLESNCDVEDLPDEQQRKLNVVYSVKIPGENYNTTEFSKPPTDHHFPVTDIGNNVYLKVVLESLPRIEDIPNVKCTCQKRQLNIEIPQNLNEDLVGKLNDLSLGSKCDAGNVKRPTASHQSQNEYVFIKKDVLDDRMLTPCSENGKHKCSCDDELDEKEKTKRLDERRLKEIAKCKRRLRKESRIKKQDEEKNRETTSIPILQAARFDRFRAIGCYRNQTYLTLPASRIETRSPFAETDCVQIEVKKTSTVSTQTDEPFCQCGTMVSLKCEGCRLVRSEGTYNLAVYQDENSKKHKCDVNCDSIIRRPKLRRLLPVTDRIEEVITDRQRKDIAELNLNKDDTVFCSPRDKRQKTYSVSDDGFVLYERCEYGTIDRCEGEAGAEGVAGGSPVPSPSDVDKFKWRLDSAASMVFHTKTGLPLTSSPAPLRRGTNCFDFDDTINGVSGIKSALFHRIAPRSPTPPGTASPPPRPLPPTPPARTPGAAPAKLRIGPSRGLLGSFEESALKGRLEPVATVQGFTAELGASGSWCPPHRRLPVTVFFYAPGGTNAPYMGHINLGPSGYRIPHSGTIQVSLFNPHGTLVKMFVVLYELSGMPPSARTFLRQRTLYMPAGAEPPRTSMLYKWLRYLIHLRFMTSKSGKLYLHTDIRILVSRKADVDTATVHSIFRPISNSNRSQTSSRSAGPVRGEPDRGPNRVFGGCGDPGGARSGADPGGARRGARELGYENHNGVAFELRSFTYAPDNPRYSPR